jgi:L,D-transpeptidase YbiS
MNQINRVNRMKQINKLNLLVDISRQTLAVREEEQELKKYSISTAFLGAGEEKNSFKTPRGRHIIRAKIGKDAPNNAVFVGRRMTGEIYSPELKAQFPDRDWILTRILWLSGLEIGKNRLGSCDSMQRYIYIHGSPDESPMGIPKSNGCIRMRNTDIIELFNWVDPGTIITIQ